MTLFLSQLWSVLHDPDPQIQVRCEPARRAPLAEDETRVPPHTPFPQRAVHWNEAGDGFIIADVHAFEQQVLPAYYKHK